MDSEITDESSIEEEHYHLKNGIKTLCSEEVSIGALTCEKHSNFHQAWKYIQNLPRNFLDASEKQILTKISDYFTSDPPHWLTDPSKNAEKTFLQNTEATINSPNMSEETQPPTSTSRKLGRPKKAKPRLSWAEQLHQIQHLELEEDIVNLLGSSGTEDEIIRALFKNKHLTGPRGEGKSLF